MAVLVQEQVAGVFSGVAFSRDPVSRCGDAVAIEALPGEAAQVVSGQVTPERYHVSVSSELATLDWRSPATGQDERLVVSGDSGDVPLSLLRRVAVLARQLEQRLQNVPQDLEWSYDGDRLWVLQARPISTLLPIWTRQIAAEVIPGFIRPLTWSINRPLTCGVWGEIFSIVCWAIALTDWISAKPPPSTIPVPISTPPSSGIFSDAWDFPQKVWPSSPKGLL